MKYSVVVTGVTEQPVYWAAQVLMHVGFNRGHRVYLSGSPEARAGKGVTAHVRWGDSLLSPIVPKGDCQLVLGLEPLEAARVALSQYTPGMKVVSAVTPLAPTSVTHGSAQYPNMEEVFSCLQDSGIDCKAISGYNNNDAKLSAISLVREAELGDHPKIETEELVSALLDMGEAEIAKAVLKTSN